MNFLAFFLNHYRHFSQNIFACILNILPLAISPKRSPRLRTLLSAAKNSQRFWALPVREKLLQWQT
jgi:hypothetical protein